MVYKPDALTGLHSRDQINHIINNRLKGRHTLTVAVFDLDFFTNINEKIGRTNGDRVLKNIAQDLKVYDDVVAGRYGSDEFIFVFTDKSDIYVKSFLDDYKQQFRKSRFITIPPYDTVRMTFSMGVSKNSKNIDSPFLLLKSAETALFDAKKSGRNRIKYADGTKISILYKNGICTTIIGKSLKGSCKNGDIALTASISEPYGVCLDNDNNLVFVDRSNHQIKLVRDNKVYVVAGNGKSGNGVEGTLAVHSMLCKPSGVYIARTGDIHIADTGNHCIKKIRNGIITTLAGSNKSGYSGDGGPATMARLNRPGGVAVDDIGNVYTNDYGNNVIRKIDINGIISTVVGSGAFGYSGDNGSALEATLNKPYGLCVSKDGHILYIADYGNHCIREVNLKTNTIRTLCGNGMADYSGDGKRCDGAQLNGPFWVSLSNNNLFIADANNHRVRKIDLRTKIIETIAGNGTAGYTDHRTDINGVALNLPAGLAVNEKHLYIADYGNNAIRRTVINW